MTEELKASHDRYMTARQQLLSDVEAYFPVGCLISFTLLERFEVRARVVGFYLDEQPSLLVKQDSFDNKEFFVDLTENPVKVAE